MSSNLTIESPNFDKIADEAGQFTSDGIALVWAAENDTRKTQRTGIRLARDIEEPKVLQIAAAGSVDNLDITGYSVVEFTGGSAQNFTGMRAPETGRSRRVTVYVSGSGTITARHNLTSESANQLDNATAADVALATRGSATYLYLSGKWRQV